MNEPRDDSPSGQLLEGVIESIDEFYTDSLGQDVKRGMREKMQGVASSMAAVLLTASIKLLYRMVPRPDIS